MIVGDIRRSRLLMTSILRILENIGIGEVTSQRVEDMDVVTFRRSGNWRCWKLWSSEVVVRDTK